LLRFAIVLTGIVLYAPALSHPALLFRIIAYSRFNGVSNVTVIRMQTYTGAQMLHNSIVGPLILNFAGLANPLLWFSWLFLLSGRIHHAFLSSRGAAILSLQILQNLLFPVPMDEGGVQHAELVHPLFGYYLWASSILITLAASWYWRPVPPPKPPAPGGLESTDAIEGKEVSGPSLMMIWTVWLFGVLRCSRIVPAE
jgi:hypothetical protein